MRTNLIVRKNDSESIQHVRKKIDNFRLRVGVQIRHLGKLVFGVVVEDGSGLLYQGLTDEGEQGLQLLSHGFGDMEHGSHAVNILVIAT